MEDESGKLVYEAKMLKFSLFGASPFEFENHISGAKTEYKVGKTVTKEETFPEGTFITKSHFNFNDKKIWEYLREKDIVYKIHVCPKVS